jgi:hypothetical protein
LRRVIILVIEGTVRLEGEDLKPIALLLCAVICLSFSAEAEAALYGATASGSPGELYVLDSTSGAVLQDVGPLNDSLNTNYPITGLAFNPYTGVLYGSTATLAAVPGHLVTIDPASALVTDVGSFNLTIGTLSDLAFDPAGKLYGIASKNGPQLYSVDRSTGQATEIGSSGMVSTEGGGLAVSPTNVFFATPRSTLFGTYNSTTGAFTNIANPAKPAGGGAYAALAFDGSVLYGINSGPSSPPPIHLVTFDTTTGAVTDIGASVSALDAIAFQTGLIGDFNHNNTVDAPDYVAWRKSLGTTYIASDYNVWRSHFGQNAGSGAGSSVTALVPEPATWMLLLVACVGLRRRILSSRQT